MAFNYSSLVIFFVIISSLVLAGNAQQAGGGGGGGNSNDLACIKQLLPCDESLRKKVSNPPGTCCIPLQNAIATNPKCLCAVLNNAGILSFYNITRNDALDLAKYCHANADVSVCDKLAVSPVASATLSQTPAASPPCSGSSDATGLIVHMKETVAISAIVFLFHSILG